MFFFGLAKLKKKKRIPGARKNHCSTGVRYAKLSDVSIINNLQLKLDSH